MGCPWHDVGVRVTGVQRGSIGVACCPQLLIVVSPVRVDAFRPGQGIIRSPLVHTPVCRSRDGGEFERWHVAGTLWRKTTRLALWSWPGSVTGHLDRRCTPTRRPGERSGSALCSRSGCEHERLSGTVQVNGAGPRVFRSQLAAAYPEQFVAAVACNFNRAPVAPVRM